MAERDGETREPGKRKRPMGSVAIYWTRLPEQGWGLHLAATEQGLLYVGSCGRGLEEVATWVNRRVPGAELIRSDPRLQPYAEVLGRYLGGEPGCFQEVWRALTEIPYGECRSYSAIAERIGRPSAVRAVGAAIGANPLQIVIPCHRVLGKSGALTGFRGGLEMKERLLALERRSAEQSRT
jgi:methylated-DNA-[protein]-cysteine S-methyltransferase